MDSSYHSMAQHAEDDSLQNEANKAKEDLQTLLLAIKSGALDSERQELVRIAEEEDVLLTKRMRSKKLSSEDVEKSNNRLYGDAARRKAKLDYLQKDKLKQASKKLSSEDVEESNDRLYGDAARRKAKLDYLKKDKLKQEKLLSSRYVKVGEF